MFLIWNLSCHKLPLNMEFYHSEKLEASELNQFTNKYLYFSREITLFKPLISLQVESNQLFCTMKLVSTSCPINEVLHNGGFLKNLY